MVIARFLRRFRFRSRFGLPQAQTSFEHQDEHIGDNDQGDDQIVARRDPFVKEEDCGNSEHNHDKRDDGPVRPQRLDAGASSNEPDEERFDSLRASAGFEVLLARQYRVRSAVVG